MFVEYASSKLVVIKSNHSPVLQIALALEDALPELWVFQYDLESASNLVVLKQPLGKCPHEYLWIKSRFNWLIASLHSSKLSMMSLLVHT